MARAGGRGIGRGARERWPTQCSGGGIAGSRSTTRPVLGCAGGGRREGRDEGEPCHLLTHTALFEEQRENQQPLPSKVLPTMGACWRALMYVVWSFDAFGECVKDVSLQMHPSRPFSLSLRHRPVRWGFAYLDFGTSTAFYSLAVSRLGRKPVRCACRTSVAAADFQQPSSSFRLQREPNQPQL